MMMLNAEQDPLLPGNRRDYVIMAAVAVLYFVTGKLSFMIEVSHVIVTQVVFFPEGISLAATLLIGRRIWPGVLIGQFFLAYSSGASSLVAAGIAIVNGMGPILSALIFSSFHLNKQLIRSRDVIGFILLIVIVLAPFSATFGNLVLLYNNVIAIDEYANSWYSWFIGNVIGQLIIASTVIFLFTTSITRNEVKSQLLPGIVITAIACWLTFYQLKITNILLIMSLSVPAVLFFCISTSMQAALTATSTMTIFTLIATRLGYGPFAADTDMLNMNIFLLGNALSALIIGTTFMERKGIIADMEKLNARMRLATQSLGFGVWEIDLQNYDVSWDERQFALFNIDPATPAETLYQRWKDKTLPEDVEKVETLIQKCLKDPEEKFQGEFRSYGPNNDIRHIGFGGLIQYDEQKNPLRFIGMNWDITSKVLADKALIENEEKIRTINTRLELATKSLGLGIWDHSLLNHDLIWDKRSYELFWIDPSIPEKSAYKAWRQCIDPEDLRNLEALTKQCMENPEIPFEGKYRVYGPNHELRWIGMGGLIQRDENNKPVRMIGVNWDITQSVLVEQYLQDSQTKLQNIIDAATEFSIITTDIDGTIELFSKGAEIMLGYKASELIGKKNPSIIHLADEVEKQGKLLSEEFGYPIEGFNVFVERAKRGYAEALEWTYVRKDGSTLPVNLIVTALRDSEDRITGFLGIAKNITAEKLALETLAKAKEDAEQANLAKSRFLANMSHEIRTPMNAILGMIQLLLNTGLDKRQKDYAEKSQTAAKSLLLILNDILDLSKVEAGKMSLENHSFRIDQLINEIATIGTVNADAKNIQFQISKDNRIPNRLLGDSVRLKQILNNLSGNAIKFTDSGSVFLSIQLLSINENTASLRFSIKDSGIGISKENIEKIFDSFSQAESSTTRRFGGTGLGLTISKDLVELMGGKLQVESQPGVGSHFYFDIDFNLDKSEENISHPISSSTTERLTGISILVAEDNPMNQQIIRELLNLEGARVELANNGKIALEKLLSSEHEYHVILMDLQMPEMDGITATREIRKIPRFQQLPIIAMTANVMQTDIDNCISAGMNAHISKPIDIEIAVSTLLEHCHNPISNTENTIPTPNLYNQNEFKGMAEQQEENLSNEENLYYSQIDTKSALERIGNNQVLYAKMLRLFMHDSASLLASYRQQMESANPVGAADAMHTLKSLAGTIGLNELAMLASTLEKQLRTDKVHTNPLIDSVGQLEKLLDRYTQPLRQLEKQLSSYRPKAPANTKVLDKSVISQILKDMNELLTTGNMRATRLFATLKEQYGSALGNHLLPLDNALDQLDFTLALEESRKLHANLDKIC